MGLILGILIVLGLSALEEVIVLVTSKPKFHRRFDQHWLLNQCRLYSTVCMYGIEIIRNHTRHYTPLSAQEQFLLKKNDLWGDLGTWALGHMSAMLLLLSEGEV